MKCLNSAIRHTVIRGRMVYPHGAGVGHRPELLASADRRARPSLKLDPNRDCWMILTRPRATPPRHLP
jgi:hypothetical protein